MNVTTNISSYGPRARLIRAYYLIQTWVMHKLFKEDHCKGKGLICTIFLSFGDCSSSHLSSYLGIAFLNSGWNIIIIIPKTRLGLRSAKSSIQQIRVVSDKQTAKPRIKNTLGGLSFVPLIFLQNVNLLKAGLGHSRSALISNNSDCIIIHFWNTLIPKNSFKSSHITNFKV